MFQNYVKIAWRNLTKQPLYSAIKIGGFALGIAACFLIALYILDELSFDKHYPDRVYRVVGVYNFNDKFEKSVWFQAPFARALKEDYPEIEKSGRYNSSELFGAGNKEIRPADGIDNTYEEGFVYVDQELLDIFHLPLRYGNPSHALDQPNTIVITKRKADKYFPNEDPVGKAFIIDNDVAHPYKIGGVIENFPPTSHLQFDFLITLKGVEFWPGEQSYWGATNYPTYLVLRPGADAVALAKKMSGVITKYMLPLWIKEEMPNAREFAKTTRFELQPVREIHLRSTGISDAVSHGDIRFVWLFGSISVFIMILACINFINLSTARSANRAKEVGLRKTVGSFRSNIINQFLTESLIFSFLSFGLGVLLAGLLLPYFNALAAKSMVIPWTDWRVYGILVGAAIGVGVLAGLYPAFYLSGFKPINVLKGNLSLGSKSATTRSSLVIFQFTTSIVLIIATFIIYRQVDYILNLKVGFEKNQVIMIQGTNTLGDQVKTFKNELLQLSATQNATISGYLPVGGTKRNGNGFWIEGRQTEDKSVSSQIWRVDEDYIQTLGMKIASGRDFSPRMKSDSQAIIINQKMARDLGLKDPIGKRIMNNHLFTVIGVVEDFNFESLRGKIEPLCLVLGNSPTIVSIKVNSSDMPGTLKSIDAVWKKFSPHQPIRYSFLSERFARAYDDVRQMGRIFISFAALAIIVACLGLFALSAFMVEQRSKEISIRLVLGASLNNIFNLLTLNFVKLVMISIVIAVPLAWYMMRQWLDDFSYRTPITWDVFALAGVMAVAIALVTISYQSVKAALAEPVKNLTSS
jgi:putative ABC transport system permease protein